MMSTLYAEFRKFATIRSTYIVSLLALLLGGALIFWGHGYKGGPVYPTNTLQDGAMDMMSVVGIFTGIIAILLICHEYRYNTIGYTLTASNNRLKVLFAKLLITGGYAVIMTLLSVALSMVLTILGAKLAHHYMPTQTVDVFEMMWRSLAYMVGGIWFALFLGFLSRSLVFALVAYFLIPAVEPLLHMLLKISNNYMPSSAQGQILQFTHTPGVYSAEASAGVFGLYVLVMLVVSAVLFVSKDAN